MIYNKIAATDTRVNIWNTEISDQPCMPVTIILEIWFRKYPGNPLPPTPDPHPPWDLNYHLREGMLIHNLFCTILAFK